MMKRLLCVLLMLGVSGSAFAVENSITYMPLTRSDRFNDRVAYILTMEAPVIEAEAATGTYTAACHTLRANLAASVARGPQGYVPIFSVHLVTNVNITSGGALTGTGNTLDSPATDAAILAAVASLWSTVAGCITNP